MRRFWIAMVPAWLLGLLPCCPAAANGRAEGCEASAAPVLAEYRVSSPLLATDPAHLLRVTLHADGCAVSVLPAHYVKSGTYAERLSASELAVIRGHLGSIEVLQFDAAAGVKRPTASAAAEGARVSRVYDEDIVEIELHPALAPKRLAETKHLRLASLRTALLAAPDDQQLVALAAAQEALADLAMRHLAEDAR